MSTIVALARKAARALPYRMVRAKIALLYGGLFLVSGASLLGVTYILVFRAVSVPPADNAPENQNNPPPMMHPSEPNYPNGPTGRVTQTGGELAKQLSDVMHQLLVNSALALAIMSVLSIMLGWFVAGRMLRPLRTITATVRDISATSLHRRLALEGPHDELKELGDTFDSLLGRLESSFQAQRRFVANASHELRTPLARQRAIGQVALSDPNATVESLRAAHERILVSGAQQERLIEALLTLTRGHAGIEVWEPFDLADLVDEVVDARRSEAGYRGVRFAPSILSALVAGHRNLAERLVTNLVDNALRYNVSGGWVEVTTRVVEGRSTLTVVNTGPVVPPDVTDDLFQPFRRLGADRVADAEGLGLGLSIVQAIAAAHGATISTIARPEGGLAITVTFPSVSSQIHRTVPYPAQPAIGARHR
jgi:signal transduction histidine kinase